MLKKIQRTIEETVEVGPGYLKVWRSYSDVTGWSDWKDNRSITGQAKRVGDPTEKEPIDAAPSILYLGSPMHTRGERSIVYVPADVTVADALAAINSLKPAKVVEPAQKPAKASGYEGMRFYMPYSQLMGF